MQHRRDAHSFAYTPSGAKSKGDTDVLNDIVIFYLDDASATIEAGVCHGAKKALFPKTASLVINEGDRVYWNDTTKKVTKTNTDRAIGWCIADALAADTTVLIRFHQEVESATY